MVEPFVEPLDNQTTLEYAAHGETSLLLLTMISAGFLELQLIPVVLGRVSIIVCI